MICHSAVARRTIHVVASSHGGVVVPYLENPYPRGEEGILAHRDAGGWYVPVGDRSTLRVDDALAKSADDVHPEGNFLRILTASVKLADSGDFHLVLPSRDDDYSSTLVLIDYSRGRSGKVRFKHSNPAHVYLRGYQNHEPFVGDEEVLFACLAPGEHITAVRSSKRFIWFGKEAWEEEIHFSYDRVFHAALLKADGEDVTRLF